MPEVETNDYTGKNRRNGSSLRLSTRDWIYIGTLFITFILAWGNMKWTGEANARQINKNTLLVDNHEIKIAVIQNSIGNIEKNIDEIKNILKNNRK